MGVTSRQKRPLEEYSLPVNLLGPSWFVSQWPRPALFSRYLEFLSICVGGSRWGRYSPLPRRLAILSTSLYPSVSPPYRSLPLPLHCHP